MTAASVAHTPETRAHRRIRQAVEARGYELIDLYYDPDRTEYEMSGSGDGWYGSARRVSDGRHEVIASRNVAAAMSEIGSWQ